MADFTVGEAWVDLVPSARGFSRKAQQELAGLDLEASVDLDADATKLRAAIKQAKAELERLQRDKTSPAVDLDIGVAEARIAELKAKLEDLGKKDSTPKVRADIAVAERDLAKVERELAELNQRKADVDVDADIAGAQARIAELEQKLTEVDARRAEPSVTADTSQARGRLSELSAQIDRLSSQRATPAVELQVARARQEMLALRAELARLSAMRPSVQVNADIASASAKIAALNAQLAQIGNKSVNVSADSGGLGSAAGAASLLAAALGAVGAAAPAAVSGLVSAARAAAVFAQAGIAAAAGFSGIGDALSAVQSQQKKTATAGAQSASSQQSSMRQVASAARALQQAQIQQSRTAIQGAQQVASAQRALAAAQVAAGRAAITGAQQIASAQRALASAQLQATRSIEDAQKSYTRAVEQEGYAQEAVAQARKDATRALADLQLQQSGAALSQERATLNLEKAQQRYNNAVDAGIPEGSQKQEMDLDVREAAQALAEAQARYKNLSEDAADFARTGVEGSQQVVQAQRALKAAQDATSDSAIQLSRAQVDGAQQVQEAQIALAQAVQQAGWAQEDAARAVADAQIALGEAQQQAQWANEDAARAVEDAQRALADAYTDAGAAGVAGADDAAYALSQLTPAGREFVRFLVEEWLPTWKKTSDAVAEQLLPRVETAMRNLMGLEPEITAGLADTGRVLGDLAIKGSELTQTGPFRKDFADIMASNNRQLENYGNAGISLFGAFTDLMAVASPVAEEFSRLAEYSADAFESWVIGARQTGELQGYLQKAADTLMWLGGVLIDIGGDVLTLAGNLAPLGVALIEGARYVADLIANLSNFAGPVMTSVVAGVGIGIVALSKLGTAMSGLALANGATGIRAFAGVMGTVLNPAALYATSTMSGLRTGFQNVGYAASTGVAGLTGSAAASRATATGFGLAGKAVSGMASALPLVAVAAIGASIANDALNSSFDEGVTAMGKGGRAAADFRAEMARNDQVTRDAHTAAGGFASFLGFDWVRANVAGIQSTDEFNAANDRRRASLTDLQRVQEDAGIAQGDYETALRETGPVSDRTAAAHGRLVIATQDVQRAQEDARRATMTATQALQDQQDQILGSINSRLGLESSMRGVARAQDDYAKAVQDSGVNSMDAQDAYGRLQDAQTRQAGAARKAAEDEAKRRGETDLSIASNDAYARSIGDMVAKTQGELTPALRDMVNSLDASGLKAAGARIEFDKAGRAVATFPNGKTVVLDANTSPVYANLATVKAAVDATKGTVGIDADPGIGISVVQGFKLQTDATRGVVTIDGNISPADQQRLGIQAKTDGTTGTMFINGNPVPCDGQLNGARIRTDATTGTMTIDGNPVPANNQSLGAGLFAAGQRPVFPVNADGNPARRESDNVHRYSGAAQLFSLSANPDYQGINGFFRYIMDGIGSIGRAFASVFSAGGRVGAWLQGYAEGGVVQGYAAGGPVEVSGYALGGTVPDTTRTRGYAQGAGGQTRIPASDTVPAMLTPGEFVVRKQAVEKIGVPALMAINGMALGGPVAPLGLSLGGVTPKISGMAGGRMSRPVGFATGGTAATPAAMVMSTRDYDTGSRVVARTAVGATSARSAPSALIGEYHQHFDGSNVSATDALETTMYTVRRARRGGVHGDG